mgnify:FL=1
MLSYNLAQQEPVLLDFPRNPCIPSPCGQFSQCRDNNGFAICSCLSNYIGNPPNCHPECTINSECSQVQSCINNRCQDPCVGVCALNTDCRVYNHNPVCKCLDGYTGDPFSNCYPNPIPRKIIFSLHPSV